MDFLGMGEDPHYSDPAWWVENPGLDVRPAEKTQSRTEPQLACAKGMLGMKESETNKFKPAANPPADCFYLMPLVANSLHCTNLSSSKSTPTNVLDWIAPQASCFNHVARIFTPHYRQTTATEALRKISLLESLEDSFAQSYGDVKTAFEMYLDKWHKGRPIFILGHDLGARMVHRLLKDVFDDDKYASARKCLVGAYTAGASLNLDMLPKKTALASGPGQLGTLAHWCAATPEAVWNDKSKIKWIDEEPGVCTNPITWMTSKPGETNSSEKPEDFLGALGMTASYAPCVYEDCVCKAEVSGGMVRIIPADHAKDIMGFYREKEDYHTLDVHLFYGNIRQNATSQLSSWNSQK